MAGGNLAHLSAFKSALMELFFKPALICAAIIARVWLGKISPPKCYNHEQIVSASARAVEKTWGKDGYLMWKMGLFAYIVAAFCEADNAYSVWFFNFAEEVKKIKDGVV